MKTMNYKIKHMLIKLLSCINDKLYLQLIYRIRMGRRLDFSNCKTMNEKLQWLKINNRYDELTTLVDKIKVKDYVKSIIGSQYIIPTIKVWKTPNDIKESDIVKLPQSFVVKTNHSGGNMGVMIYRDKSKLNLPELRKIMDKSLHEDIYNVFREWPYKNIDKKILAEEYLGENLTDYKFYCFNGEVDSVLVCLDRQSERKTKFYFFDKTWKLRRYNKAGRDAPENFSVDKPENLEEMFEIASKLSIGHPFVRVDLYNINGKIYFGELTFFPDSGFDLNRLPETDIYFGNKIDLTLAKIQK